MDFQDFRYSFEKVSRVQRSTCGEEYIASPTLNKLVSLDFFKPRWSSSLYFPSYEKRVEDLPRI